jgi:hypothetical protein
MDASRAPLERMNDIAALRQKPAENARLRVANTRRGAIRVSAASGPRNPRSDPVSHHVAIPKARVMIDITSTRKPVIVILCP